jgi:hypothetical protein
MRVQRLMQQNGIRSREKKRFKVTTDSKHDLPIAPCTLKQNGPLPRRKRQLNYAELRNANNRGKFNQTITDYLLHLVFHVVSTSNEVDIRIQELLYFYKTVILNRLR